MTWMLATPLFKVAAPISIAQLKKATVPVGAIEPKADVAVTVSVMESPTWPLAGDAIKVMPVGIKFEGITLIVIDGEVVAAKYSSPA